MKTLFLSILAVGCLLAQPQRPPQLSPGGRVQALRPSRAYTGTLPAQTITVTLTLTSDDATRLEQERRDDAAAVVDDPQNDPAIQSAKKITPDLLCLQNPASPYATCYVPNALDIDGQLQRDIAARLKGLQVPYPSAAQKAAHARTVADQKAEQDLLNGPAPSAKP